MISRFLMADEGRSDPPAMLFDGRIGAGLARAGVTVTEKTVLTVPAFFRAIKNLSSHFAMLPAFVVETVSDGERQRHPVHPVHQALNVRANPETKPFDLKVAWMVNLILWGKGYVQCEFTNDRSRVAHLWNLPSRRVRMKRDKATSDLYYEYRNDDGKAQRFEEWEILRLSDLSFDGLRPVSLIEDIAKENMGLAIAVQRYAESYFGNNSIAGTVLTSTVPMTNNERRDAEKEIESKLMGPLKAFRTLFLAGGVKVERMMANPEQSQLAGVHTMTLGDAARWIGVPPPMLFDYSRSTFNNITEIDEWYVKYSLQPMLKPIEEELNFKIFNLAERGRFQVKFNVDSILRGNPAVRGPWYKSMHSVGAYSTNDIRAKEDENGVGPKGDTRYVDGNKSILGEVTQTDRGASAGFDGRGRDNEEEPEERAAFSVVHYSLVNKCKKLVHGMERIDDKRLDAQARAQKINELFQGFASEFSAAIDDLSALVRSRPLAGFVRVQALSDMATCAVEDSGALTNCIRSQCHYLTSLICAELQ